MGTGFDARAQVQRHAARAGLDLPTSTIDELALHLDDLIAAARADGATDDEARRRALSALEESTLTPLRRHASRSPERLQARQLVHFYNADPAYGRGAAKEPGPDMEKSIPWTKLSLKELAEKTT